MTARLSLAELRDLLQPLIDEYAGTQICHEATGSLYKITGFHFKESTMQIEFTYQTQEKCPIAFSRPIAELTDGHFVNFGDL